MSGGTPAGTEALLKFLECRGMGRIVGQVVVFRGYINYYSKGSPDSLCAGNDGGPAPNWGGWFGSSRGGGSGTPLSSLAVYSQWLHIQYLHHGGTPGKHDGSLVIYINGTLRIARDGNAGRLNSADDPYIRDIWLGNYFRCSDPHGEAQIFWESAYLDNTWARVEIGDKPTYASCTHREIQVPCTWSDTSVTFTVNRGSFAPGAAVYIFVVDAGNTPHSVGSVLIGAD